MGRRSTQHLGDLPIGCALSLGSDGCAGRPDLPGVFSPASYRSGRVGILDSYPGMRCGYWLHRPLSTGRVTIRSTDPRQPPMIDAAHLTHEDDRQSMLQGLRRARQLLATRALAIQPAAPGLRAEET